MGIRDLFDPESGMEKFRSGINIPDPQHWFFIFRIDWPCDHPVRDLHRRGGHVAPTVCGRATKQLRQQVQSDILNLNMKKNEYEG